MKGYKGFEKGLVCRGKQYAENTIFEEDTAVICEKGMHFCKNPLDVLDYYPLINENGEQNDFCDVEALDEVVTDDNKKFATKKLKVGAKLSLKGFIEAAVNFVFETEKPASGFNSKLAASGFNSKLAASGDDSKLAASGNYSKLAASGNYSKLAASGEKSVVCGIGINNIVKAAIGSWITLAEYDSYGVVELVKTEYVDGERIKADTWYQLKDGEFQEVKNEE